MNPITSGSLTVALCISSGCASQPPGELAENDAAMMIASGAEPDFCGSANRECNGKAVYRELDAE